MNAAFVGQLLAAILGGGVLVAVINAFLSPKTRAETRAIAAKSAQETIDAALTTLRADLARAVTRADAAEAKADDAENRLDVLVARDRVLIDYLWRLMKWSRIWYDAGHPPDMLPPPEPPDSLRDVLP